MSGLDKDRYRNKTVSFRMSPDERLQLESRIKVSGIPKGQFIIQSLLQNKIDIIVGKYQSDRLSLEIKKLREAIEKLNVLTDDEELIELSKECNTLMKTILQIMNADGPQSIRKDDFRTTR